MSAEALVEKSIELRTQKRYEEALLSSLAAIEADPSHANAWWQTALNRIDLNDKKNALKYLQKTVELVPEFDTAWARLGAALLDNNKKDEAKAAFEQATRIDATNAEALRGLSRIYHQENDPANDAEETRILEKLDLMEYQIDLNRLGILHWRNSNVLAALDAWKKDDSFAGIYNSGLAYAHGMITQFADAIDAWRLVSTLREDPQADEQISKILPSAVEVGKQFHKTTFSLDKNDWYQEYLSPFCLLKSSEELDPFDLDAKEIQKQKKFIAREIDLEDGRISWIPVTCH